MTIDIAQSGRYVFYLNFRTQGDGTNFAVAEQVFNFANLIEDASKYVVSVERFRVPLQAIPMLPFIQNAIQLVPKAAAPFLNFDLQPTFSLNEFLTQINSFGVVFSLSADGRMVIDFDNFTDYELHFAPKIAAIFDMPGIVGALLVGAQTIRGASPIFDRFDDLHKIQIESRTGLAGIQQEIITTNVFANLLTDFLVPSSTTMSYTGRQGLGHDPTYSLGYNVREDVEFNNSASRRFIMLKGNAPVQNISLEIAAIFRDGTRHRIIMPPNSLLEVKLAFWRKE